MSKLFIIIFYFLFILLLNVNNILDYYFSGRLIKLQTNQLDQWLIQISIFCIAWILHASWLNGLCIHLPIAFASSLFVKIVLSIFQEKLMKLISMYNSSDHLHTLSGRVIKCLVGSKKKNTCNIYIFFCNLNM